MNREVEEEGFYQNWFDATVNWHYDSHCHDRWATPNSAAGDDFWRDKGSFTGCLHDVTKKLTSNCYLFSTLFNSNRLWSGNKIRRGCCSNLGGCLLRSLSGEPTCFYIFVYTSSVCLADWYLFKLSPHSSFLTLTVSGPVLCLSSPKKLYWILFVMMLPKCFKRKWKERFSGCRTKTIMCVWMRVGQCDIVQSESLETFQIVDIPLIN